MFTKRCQTLLFIGMFGGLAGNPDQAETLPYDAAEPYVEGYQQPAPKPSDDTDDEILRAKTLVLGDVPDDDDENLADATPSVVEPEPAPVGGHASQTVDKPAGDDQVASKAEPFDAMKHQVQNLNYVDLKGLYKN